MKLNSGVYSTVVAIMAAHAAAALAQAQLTSDTATTGVTALQEVIVTAERRSEDIQNVPMTIQALTGTTLSQLNVQTFDQFVKYLPNVITTPAGPAQGLIFMRGLTVGGSGQVGQGSGSTGSFPVVAIYLD